MKIFISYSRRDADFAQQIDEYFQGSGHDVFTDVKDIQAGVVWSSAIETNISKCDIFVVIVTDPALRSSEVEKEVLQAQRENKKIIPCFHRSVLDSNIKWGLNKIQGVEFDDKYELARNIHSKISKRSKIGSKQIHGINLKLIIIPIIAVAIIGVIVAVSYFNSSSEFINAWGTKGSGNGQFEDPTDIAVDSYSGFVYVTDDGNDRIQKFRRDGTFLDTWGSYGTGDGQFWYPSGVSVDSSTGSVYVVDFYNDNVQKFDRRGEFVTKLGTNGSGDGQFLRPTGIAIDSSTGSVYVSDTGNDRIQKFDSNGKFLMKWGNKGEGDGQFKNAWDIAVDSSTGTVYVNDNSERIQKFDSNGKFLMKWRGEGSISSLAADSIGNVYVGTMKPSQIQKFDSNGNFITKWGSQGSGNGQLQIPTGIAIDSSTGRVYVVDSDNNRIQVFVPSK